MKHAALLSLALAGCLSVPDGGGKPQCETSADCNSAAGEVCQEGVCWGDPPMGRFAATIGTPSGNADLVGREITDLQIPTDGWIGDIMLDKPVTLAGRIEAACDGQTCTHAALSAKVIVKRAPLFYGGTGFRKAADSIDGITGKSDTFSLTLPRSQPSDPPYEITIQPADRATVDAASSPAELVPPLHLELRVTDDMIGLPIALGGSKLPTITGKITDPFGAGLGKYRVVALGRWKAEDPTSEVSTVAYTTDGNFTITLSDGLIGNVEIVARSVDPNATRATLRLGGFASITSTQHNVAEPMNLGEQTSVIVHVEGVSGNGEVKPLAGARVRIAGLYAPPLAGGARAELVAEGFTETSGDVKLAVLDGAALVPSYTLSVVPPPGSNLGIMYNQPLMLATNVPVRLPSRVALKGTLVDVDGNALKGVSVTARPSIEFRLALDSDAAAFLDAIPPANTSTPANGEFVLWVDPQLAQIWGSFDIAFDPPASVDAPAWTKRHVEVDRSPQVASQSLGTVALPGAAWIHARITDGRNVPVAGAELQVFRIATDTTLCDNVPGCVIPAQLQGHGTSDDTGKARLTLPRE